MRSVLTGTTLLWLVALSQFTAPNVPWPVNGGPDNIRYSALDQINRTNVERLQVAWTYDSHDSFRSSEMQSNPIVVDGVLYATTPTTSGVVSGRAERKRHPRSSAPARGAPRTS